MQVEAFTHLGLPQWFRIATGWIALAGVVGLIFGFWNEIILVLAALWIACIMLGAVLSHIRVKDPIGKNNAGSRASDFSANSCGCSFFSSNRTSVK